MAKQVGWVAISNGGGWLSKGNGLLSNEGRRLSKGDGWLSKGNGWL